MSHLSRGIAALKLLGKAHGPTIMVVTGVASMGASVVTASRATLKVDEVLEPHVETLEKIQDATASNLPSYTATEQRKDKTVVTTRVVMDLGKLYAVSGVLFVGGAALVFGGHRIMLKRNATLAIAFTGVKKAFDAYRANVRNEFGAEADQAMLHGYQTKEFIDPQTGAVTTANVRDWDADHVDPYNRVFEQGATSQWQNDMGANKLFIQGMQRMANSKLHAQGYLYLSDVYESLGFPETDISRVVGWKAGYNPDGSREIPVVDFGLDRAMPDDWKYKQSNAIYLDFNCQGLIIGGKVQKILEQS